MGQSEGQARGEQARGPAPTGRWRAGWMPLLQHVDDRQRLALLAANMPPICRALAEGRGDGGKREEGSCVAPLSSPRPASARAPAAEALLGDFLAAAMDGLIRRWLADDAFSSLRVPPWGPAAPRGWLAGLTLLDGLIAGSDYELRAFADALAHWVEPVRAGPEAAAFHTCFRLEPPEPGGGGEAVSAPDPGQAAWALRFFLQAADDPSLLVPAGQVWRERGQVLRFLSRRVENPQERLLADLARAARLFPPIDASLRSTHPEVCGLTTAEAYQFLREVAPLLAESGLGVLVPPWWEKRTARLGVRLRMRADTARRGILNRESLVQYDWQVALGDEPLSPEEFERLAALKAPLVQIRGQWIELSPEQIERAIQFWESRRARGELALAEALRLALGAEGATDGLPLVGVEAEGELGDLVERLGQGERVAELPPPAKLHATLRPYQVRGFSWLAFLTERGFGACLADDMGLGKTLELIALLLQQRQQQDTSVPTLIICPTSVIGNWRRELERFAPSLRVMVHHGAGRLAGEAFGETARQHDVVLSTYPLVYRDQEALASVTWGGVVLDEAQNVKNPSAKQTQAVRQLRGDFRAALTGTPVENRLTELWSILEFLNPGYLGSAEGFRRQFAIPIERWQDAAAAGRLRRLVQPFILRRVKTDPTVIQDLPEKQEMKVYCTLTKEQATLYEAVVQEMLQKIDETEGIQRRGTVLSALLRLKQVCNHPAQFLGDRSPLPGRSGKLMRLEEMLEEVLAEGDRALVFTQFAEFGERLHEHLQSAFGREVLYLHGDVPQRARDQMVQRFQDQNGPPIFLLSLKAGGVGLNLTRANHVFHFDRWWNPAVENQATDRAFRIGQTRNVQVHKYLCVGTLEERIDELIESKRALAENVIGAGEGWLTELSTDELRDLFRLSQEAVAE
ncbi:MAG: DEAD/DEAH box helicase [Chloroflexi bacterium]|nr:DEAD/DEAH box helicase [Chloroflexota bacterium]